MHCHVVPWDFQQQQQLLKFSSFFYWNVSAYTPLEQYFRISAKLFVYLLQLKFLIRKKITLSRFKHRPHNSKYSHIINGILKGVLITYQHY